MKYYTIFVNLKDAEDARSHGEPIDVHYLDHDGAEAIEGMIADQSAGDDRCLMLMPKPVIPGGVPDTL